MTLYTIAAPKAADCPELPPMPETVTVAGQSYYRTAVSLQQACELRALVYAATGETVPVQKLGYDFN